MKTIRAYNLPLPRPLLLPLPLPLDLGSRVGRPFLPSTRDSRQLPESRDLGEPNFPRVFCLNCLAAGLEVR